jgi:hypothetical protein
MRARLAALVAAIAAVLTLALAPSAGPAYATCPSGTNWDNIINRCL